MTVVAAAPLAVASSAARHAQLRIDDAEGPSGPTFAVGEITLTFTDWSRRVVYPGSTRAVPRQLVTVIRYPAAGDPSQVDVPGAPPVTGAGQFPLIVFAHGYDITPTPYARLLQSWARAGYVVAAPVFPLSNADAPGGADENDLVNQPADMSFVISQMQSASAAQSGPLAGLINPTAIAVAGQSDGGSTALAMAFNRHYLDRRVGAAVILSGARIGGIDGYAFRAGGPPLLATQGTADDINLPSSTYLFFHLASRPKFLLSLLGAGHLGPYTNQAPQLGVVERTTVAFLDHFLKHTPGAGWRMWSVGAVRGVARLRPGP